MTIKDVDDYLGDGHGLYVLDDDGTVRQPERLSEWTASVEEDKNRIVARTNAGEYLISTVFLYVDHSWVGGDPLLFETMAFKNPHNGGPQDHINPSERYSTLDEAKKGHDLFVEAALKGALDEEISDE